MNVLAVIPDPIYLHCFSGASTSSILDFGPGWLVVLMDPNPRLHVRRCLNKLFLDVCTLQQWQHLWTPSFVSCPISPGVGSPGLSPVGTSPATGSAICTFSGGPCMAGLSGEYMTRSSSSSGLMGGGVVGSRGLFALTGDSLGCWSSSFTSSSTIVSSPFSSAGAAPDDDAGTSGFAARSFINSSDLSTIALVNRSATWSSLFQPTSVMPNPSSILFLHA